MLKNKIKALLVIILAIVLFFAPFVNADLEEDLEAAGIAEQIDREDAENEVGDDIENEEDNIDDQEEIDEQDNEEVKKGDQYLVGDKIELNDSVDGNVYILASDVTINSQIQGNLFICASKVLIKNDGYITNSAYIAASEINVEGTVYDLYIASKDISITGNVNRDVHIATENFSLYGSIERDASIVAKNFSFEKYEDEIVDETGVIYGNLNYSSENEIQIPEGVVEGNVKFDKTLEYNYKPNYIFMAISWIVLILVVWAVIRKILPEFENSASLLLKEKALRTFGVGLLGMLVVPMIAILLMALIVTVKAGFLLLLAYILMAILGEVIFIIALNSLLVEKFNLDTTAKKVLLLIVTSLVAWGLAMIPFVGPVFALIYSIIGFGIILSKLLSKKENIKV